MTTTVLALMVLCQILMMLDVLLFSIALDARERKRQ